MNRVNIEQITAFGKAVEEGLLSRDSAASDLVELSDGTMTMERALEIVDGWREVRDGHDTVLRLITDWIDGRADEA